MDPQHKPLILRGARQVGKTATLREFGTRFKNVCEVNLERHPDYSKVFRDFDPKRILAELEILTGKNIEPGKTLLFLDEIQACPSAISSLRYFCEEIPELHVIACGSLLEFALADIGVPVGRVSYEYLYPMSFSEFLRALGEEKLAEALPHWSPEGTVEISEPVWQKLVDQMRRYFIVGGMPAVVAQYKKTGSLKSCQRIQSELVQAFQDDMHKYAKGEQQLLNCSKLFSRLFQFVGKQVTYSHIGDGDDVKRTKRSLELLEKAMLVHWVRSTHPSGVPLGAEASDKHFKCVFLDIGLGQCLSGRDTREIIQTKNLLDVYAGKLAEQFVGQQLLAESEEASEGRRLYGWIRAKRGASSEVDYVISRNGKIIPVEVKSGKSGRLRSLKIFLENCPGIGICLQEISTTETEGSISRWPLVTVL